MTELIQSLRDEGKTDAEVIAYLVGVGMSELSARDALAFADGVHVGDTI